MNISKLLFSSQTKSYDYGLREYMLGVYNYMTFGLAITGVVAVIAARTGIALNLMRSPFGIIVALAPLFISMYMGISFNKMSHESVRNTFFGYAAIMGLSLSTIFVYFRGIDIVRALFSTASVFGAMSIYGYTTKKDLTGIGAMSMMMMFGLIIASFVNIFLRSSGFDFILSIISVVVFTLLVGYDTQKMKQIYYSLGRNQDLAKKVAIFGAMQLYMDFIAIFVHLLRIIGMRRND